MRSLSRLQIDRSEPFTSFLFFRGDSRQAADALLGQLKARDGRLTRKEMARFANDLESGRLGFKFSRTNFYHGVLGTFLNLGFIGSFRTYDAVNRGTIYVYRPIVQPIPSQAPVNPSFWRVAYDICKWWNEMMFSGDEV
jgi:hypothetical protein